MALSENKRRWLAAHPELGRHQSMKRRHDHHDYQSPCIYMITLAIKGRHPLLGAVCCPDDSHPQPWFKPSPLGEHITACWREIPQYYPQVRLLALQLMPDHLHGIIQVTERLPRHLGHVINGFKIGCNRVDRELSLSPLWEEGYNDRILLGKGQLNAMFRYLEDNPRRLWTKRNHPEFFKAQQEVMIGDQSVTVMGNRFLLDSPNKVAVKCSRKITDEELEHTMTRCLMMAQRGAVLVSPRISPGEKAVMDMVQEAGYSKTVSRPCGNQAERCSMPAPAGKCCLSPHGPTIATDTPSPATSAIASTTWPPSSAQCDQGRALAHGTSHGRRVP